jgi:competence protein ComEA
MPQEPFETRFLIGALVGIMPAAMRVVLVVFLSCCTSALTIAAQQPAVTASALQDPFPEATGKAALMKVCSNCHSAESVIQTFRTRQEWSDLIDQMARFGAEASDTEFDQILTYLSLHFSPIKINKAAAKELEGVLDVPAGVADAIVIYRQANGDFKTLDEVKKVPGLDSGKVDAQKARIVF